MPDNGPMILATAVSLASAAGINAYVPLLAIGLLARYGDVVEAPAGWEWLAHPILLGVVGALLVIELVADKIPAVDSINDIVQTLIRPTSGGIVFGSATAVDGSSGINWWAVAAGMLIALAIHVVKATTRPLIDAATVGAGTLAASAAGDAAALSLTLAGIFAPLLAIALLVGLAGVVWWLTSRIRSRLA